MRLTALVVVLAVAGCNGPQDAPPPEPASPWRDLGHFDGALDASYPYARLFTSATEWSAFFSQAMANHGPPPAPPAVDFSRDDVIVAGWWSPQMDLDLEITQVTPAHGTYVVEVSIGKGRGCGFAHAVTRPMHAVAVPKAANGLGLLLRGTEFPGCGAEETAVPMTESVSRHATSGGAACWEVSPAAWTVTTVQASVAGVLPRELAIRAAGEEVARGPSPLSYESDQALWREGGLLEVRVDGEVAGVERLEAVFTLRAFGTAPPNVERSECRGQG